MAYTEFNGELDGEEPGYVEFSGELDKPESKLDKVKSVVSKGVDAGLSMLTPKRSIADQAQTQPTQAPNAARIQRSNQIGLRALTSTEPVPEEGGFINSAGRTIGQSIKGAGQIGADYLGASPNNSVKQYGQAVIDANPTAVNSLEDIAAKPGTAVAEGTGNAAPSMAGMLGARAVGQGITALSPLAGPAAPLVAAAGQVVSWLGPAAIAGLPSYGGIRDKQILNDPAAEQSAKSKAIAAMGAAAVAGIETAFGPQNWALAAMTKQGRAALAEKFAATTLGGSALKAGFKGAGIEGSEELAQNPIEQLASGDNPTTPANIKDTLFGGAMGALTGGVLGGGTGMLLGKPINETSDKVLKYTAERGGKKASEAAQAELDRRAEQGVVNNTPETTPEAVQRIIDTGKDKAKEINKDATEGSDSIQSSIFDEPDHIANAGNMINESQQAGPGEGVAIEALRARVASGEDLHISRFPDDRGNIHLYAHDGRNKNRVRLFPTPEEQNNYDKWAHEYALTDVLDSSLEYERLMHKAMLPAIDRALAGNKATQTTPDSTPAAHVVTARDENGNVIQNLPADDNHSAFPVAKDIAGPGGTVEVRPPHDAMAERGNNTAQVVLPDNTHLPARWDVVDADSVSASLKQGVNQPRDRTRAASDVQVQGIANNPDYHRLSDSPVMDVGAPTLGHDGAIVGGNGRFEGISRAYDQDTAGNYLANLKANAAAKGIDPAKINGMKKPILVRRITRPFDARTLAVASNSGTSLQYSGLELAKIDAERMKGLEHLDITDSGDVALTGSNMQNIRHALSGYNAAELGALTDKDGMLSQEGMRRIKNSILYQAYGNSPTLSRIVESTDNDMRNISAALVKAASSVAKVRAEIAAGKAPPELDISKDLVASVETLAKIRATGQSVDEHLAQAGLFGDDLTEQEKFILKTLDTHIRSQKKLTDFIRTYYDSVGKIDLSTSDIFGAETPSKQELLKNAKERITDKQPVVQDLFASKPATKPETSSKPDTQSQKQPASNGSANESSSKDKQVDPLHWVKKYQDIAARFGKTTAEERARATLASHVIGRDFGADYIQPPDIANLKKWLDDGMPPSNQAQQKTPPASPKAEPAPAPKPAELSGIRPLLESLIKRRAAAKETEKEGVIDEAITNARAYLKTGRGDAAYFRKAASRFNDDHATRDILRSLADDIAKTNPETAKVKTEPLSVEEKARRAPVLAHAKKLGIKTVARKFSEIEKDVNRAHEMKHERQVGGLTDEEYQAYDDKVMDLQDEIDNDDVSQAAVAEVGKAHKDKSSRAYYEALIKHFEEMINESKGSKADSSKTGTQSDEKGRGDKGKSGTEKTDTKSSATGLTVQEVEKHIEPLQQVGTKKIKVAASEADLPKNIQDAIKSAGVAGVRGVYYPQTDEVWLVADKLNNADEAIMVALHEARHRGLRKLFGQGVAPIMRQIYGTNKRARDAANRMMQSTKGMSKEDATEEVLADMAIDKSAHELNGWKRLVQFIQKWLTDHGINLTFTDDMVESLVAGAETEGIAATPQTETPAFKKWFGNSKVVDKDGKPLVVYHGTVGDFSQFLSGEGGGMWFSSAPDIANRHAARMIDGENGNVMPVYLSMHNPVLIDAATGERDMSKAINAAYRNGHDGVIAKGVGDLGEKGDVYFVLKPEQIKSAIGNNGNFDASNPDIRFSRAGNNASWDAPEPSKIDNLIYTLQNKHIDLKRVVEAIQTTSGKLADQWNTNLQEELFHERAAKRTKDFVNRELKQIIMGMTLRGQSLDVLDKYLHARHAEEANNLIAQRDPNMPDGGSGMTTKDAKDYLANLPANKRTALENTAKQVDAVITKTRDTYLSYGLIDQATADSWKTMFKHYVPLMREDNDGGMGIGQGFSIKGKEAKHRTGSKRKVVDILANIALQRERAIVRGEKNRVAVSLAGLAKLNPNPDFWTFDKVPTHPVLVEKKNTYEVLYHGSKVMEYTSPVEAKKFVDFQGDPAYTINKVVIPEHVENQADTQYKNRDNVVVAKIKDSKGKIIERAVVFNEHDERAMRMATAMKNLDAAQLEGLWGVSAMITRYFAAINTQYNPIFGIINLIRDLQAAMLNLSSTAIAGHKIDVLKNILPAISAIYASTRADRKGQRVNSPMANLWEELQNEGGMTGFRDLFKTSEDRANAIKHELDPTAWMNNGLGKIFTAGGTLKVPLAVAQKQAKWIFDWLSDYNQTLEGAVRLAVYKVAIDNGLSKPQGASISKNISVNFNRKGQSGQQAGALYAFFNAAMQGTARMGETMTTMEKGDLKTFKFNRAGKTIIAGGISLGVIQALALAAAGFDDDEPPEFVRERSLIIPIGDKQYISIPMPLGFHAIPNIGRLSTEFALGGFKKPADYTAKLFSVFAEAFNPIGNAGMSIQTLAPTAIDPLVALAENRDWTGKPIYKEDFSKLSPTPGFTRFKDTASDPAKWIAEAINTISGGNKYVPGTVSPTADQIDYLVGQITGGVGRETGKAQQSIKAAYTGEDLPPHKIPLVGRFYGSSENQSSQGNAFYSNLKRINEVEAELEGRHKDKLPLDEFKAENPEYRLVKLANMVQRAVSKQRKIKSDLIAHDAPREQVKAVEERITKLMAGFNGRVKELKQTHHAEH